MKPEHHAPDSGRKIAASLIAVVATAACSGSSVTEASYCGANTIPVNGVCIAVDAGSGAESGPAGSDAGADATDNTPDAPASGEASGEAALPDSAGGPPDSSVETGPAEGGVDGGDDAPFEGGADTNDPCPPIQNGSSALYIDCDPQSNCDLNMKSPLSMCQQMTCAMGGTYTDGAATNYPATWFIRTPEAPGIDSTCARDCPSSPWVYGLSVTLGADTRAPVDQMGYKVAVPPPWFVVSGTTTPFCPISTSPAAGCAWFDGSRDTTFYLVTGDPNAPARNVSIQYSPFAMCS